MRDAGNENGLQRLEVIRKLNGENREWDNSELYRLMYKQDLYILAYERIKSHPGNMTPGTDDETLDGFSETMIEEIIHEMRTEKYRSKPRPYSLYTQEQRKNAQARYSKHAGQDCTGSSTPDIRGNL